MNTYLLRVEHQSAHVAVSCRLDHRNGFSCRDTSNNDISLLLQALDKRQAQWCVRIEDDWLKVSAYSVLQRRIIDSPTTSLLAFGLKPTVFSASLALFLRCTATVAEYPTAKLAPMMHAPMTLRWRPAQSAARSTHVSGGGGGEGGGARGTSKLPRPGRCISGSSGGPNLETSSQRRWIASVIAGMSGATDTNDDCTYCSTAKT